MIKNVRISEERADLVKENLGKIEKKTKTKIELSQDNVAKIEGEALNVWKAKDIFIAIGRGFTPMKSFELLDDETSLEVINLKRQVSGRENLERIKGRIIGKDGKCKKNIEKITNSKISIQNKTISIISDSKKIPNIRKGIGMLISGSKHGRVYNYLEESCRKIKKLKK